MKNKGLLIGLLVSAFFAITIGFMYVGASNDEIELKNQGTEQEQVCKNNFDGMFKKIAQIAEVGDQYKETFKEIYPALIEGRYKNDGNTLMKWIQESNPNFDTKLYSKLIDVIESSRDSFKHEQDKLADIVREHNNILEKWPSSMFVGGRPKLNVTFVSSGKTKEVYRTGEENDIDVFKKK